MVSTAAAHTFLVMWQEEDQASCQHRQACEDCLRRIVPGQVARLHCKGCQQATYPAERVIQAQTKVAYSRGIPAGQTKKSRIEPMIQHTLCSRRVLAELQPMGRGCWHGAKAVTTARADDSAGRTTHISGQIAHSALKALYMKNLAMNMQAIKPEPFTPAQQLHRMS
jgi:hypothetical protein